MFCHCSKFSYDSCFVSYQANTLIKMMQVTHTSSKLFQYKQYKSHISPSSVASMQTISSFIHHNRLVFTAALYTKISTRNFSPFIALLHHCFNYTTRIKSFKPQAYPTSNFLLPQAPNKHNPLHHVSCKPFCKQIMCVNFRNPLLSLFILLQKSL